MFQDLDTTLKNLFPPQLQGATTFPLLRTADKSFLAPDRNFNPGQNTVDLFLYEVKENRDLRDPTPILVKQGNTFIRQPAPVRLDCSYILTAWSSQTGDAKVAAEHQLLAEALQWLMGFPTIPDNLLQGALANSIYAPTMLIAQVDPNKNAGDFWYALGVTPRPAFYLTVTLALSSQTAIQGTLVTTHSTSSATGSGAPDADWVQMGGQVREFAANTPLSGAVVDLVDLGLRATTDRDGRYSFLRVPAGTHPLRAIAVGYQPGNKTLTVPERPEDYDIILDPLP
jgi:hypothetical protein